MKIEHIAMYVSDLEAAKTVIRTGFIHIAFSMGAKKK